MSQEKRCEIIGGPCEVRERAKVKLLTAYELRTECRSCILAKREGPQQGMTVDELNQLLSAHE